MINSNDSVSVLNDGVRQVPTCCLTSENGRSTEYSGSSHSTCTRLKSLEFKKRERIEERKKINVMNVLEKIRESEMEDRSERFEEEIDVKMMAELNKNTIELRKKIDSFNDFLQYSI
uniref:Protein translocase subunit SecD n=1 Tax=Lygus hesperus TaxID=30085 RepID=A0A0A9ZEG7_LYGHE